MSHDSATNERLQALTAGAPTRSANVRTLAKFAANSSCPTATLGFAARVDFDRILEGTEYAVPFGQSPFAFRRGNTFEDRLRKDGHAPIFGLLRDRLRYDVSQARSVSLRDRHGKSKEGMRLRAGDTVEFVRAILERRSDAPNLIDGAVFTREVGGIPAFFEADAVAAHFNEPIRAGEIKSFPTVDGQADPDKVGAAVAQVAIYILLLRDVVMRLGGAPNMVSAEALLITPLNTGLQPTMTVKDVGREVDRAGRILAQAPSALDIVESLPSDIPAFGTIWNGDESARIEAAHCLVEKVGNTYGPSCLAACGMSRLCRERAHETGDPTRIGGQLVRLLPNVSSLDRVGELAKGAPPAAGEEPVAEQLVRVERLRAKLIKGHSQPPPFAPRKAAS